MKSQLIKKTVWSTLDRDEVECRDLVIRESVRRSQPSPSLNVVVIVHDKEPSTHARQIQGLLQTKRLES